MLWSLQSHPGNCSRRECVAGWVCPQGKTIWIPTHTSSKMRLHTETTAVWQSMISFWDRAVFLLLSYWNQTEHQIFKLWARQSDQPITNLKSTHFKLSAILPWDWHICFRLNYFHDFAFLKKCNYFCWDVLSVLIAFISQYLLEQNGLPSPSQGGHLGSMAAPQTGPPRTVLPQGAPFLPHIYTPGTSPRNPWSYLPQDGCETTEAVFRGDAWSQPATTSRPSAPRFPPQVPQGLPLALARAPRQSHSPTHPFPPPLRPHRPRPAPPPLPRSGPAPLPLAANGGAGGKTGSHRVCEGAVAVWLASCSCCRSLQPSSACPAWVPVTAVLSAGEWEGGLVADSGPWADEGRRSSITGFLGAARLSSAACRRWTPAVPGERGRGQRRAVFLCVRLIHYGLQLHPSSPHPSRDAPAAHRRPLWGWGRTRLGSGGRARLVWFYPNYYFC